MRTTFYNTLCYFFAGICEDSICCSSEMEERLGVWSTKLYSDTIDRRATEELVLPLVNRARKLDGEFVVVSNMSSFIRRYLTTVKSYNYDRARLALNPSL